MAMEIYFLVKNIATATVQNVNSGEVHTYIHGKRDEMLYADAGNYLQYNLLTPYFVRQYGYKTERDAKRNWSYRNPENDKYWKTETSIIRVWVRHDNKVLLDP